MLPKNSGSAGSSLLICTDQDIVRSLQLPEVLPPALRTDSSLCHSLLLATEGERNVCSSGFSEAGRSILLPPAGAHLVYARSVAEHVSAR